MNSLIILQGLSIDELLSRIENIIEKKLEEKLALLKPSKEWRYMSRKEVAELLKISLPTVHTWMKEGLIPSYRIGNRILFKSNEVENSIKKRRFGV